MLFRLMDLGSIQSATADLKTAPARRTLQLIISSSLSHNAKNPIWPGIANASMGRSIAVSIPLGSSSPFGRIQRMRAH